MLKERKKSLMAVSGVILCGLCVGILQKADLGLDPFSCFVTGIANIFDSSYGSFYLVVTFLLLLVGAKIKKSYFGLTTLANLLLTGFIADFAVAMLDHLFIEPTYLVRVVLLSVGLILMCLAASLYFTADLGVSAYDALALILTNEYRLASFKWCRIFTDGSCVVIGALLGATVGIGTLLTAFFMGPLIQLFNVKISRPLLG